MAIAKFAENFYSFRKINVVFGTIFNPRTPDQAALADIEAKLAQAHNQYLARQYRGAIQTYQEAEALIFAQIDPGFLGNVTQISQFPFYPEIFQPLLSASLEWMNKLPVQQAVPSVRPRVSVNSKLLGGIATLDSVGVLSSKATTAAAVNTVADWQMAHSLQSIGFNESAQFFLKRAATSDPALFGELQGDKGRDSLPSDSGASAEKVGVSVTTNGGGATVVAPGLSFGEYSSTVDRAVLPVSVAEGRTLGVLVEDKPVRFQWNTGDSPPLDNIQQTVYQRRIQLQSLPDVVLYPVLPSDVALSLPHDYYYVVPLGIAECYHALGDFVNAEKYYFQAASYQYLNQVVEAPYLWQRLATLYLDWGDSLFREDDPQDALPVYEKVVMHDQSVPGSALYTTSSLKLGADQGRAVIANLGNLQNINTLGLNPITAAIIVQIWQQIQKIVGGLDFWGFYRSTVPIWTFDYLQNVAVNFAQLAINAERDVINFWDRADQATLTREQLSQNVQQSQAEVQAAQMQAAAAAAEANAYGVAQALAQQRAADAQQNANQYAADSSLAIQFQAAQVQVSGGDDGDIGYLNSLADTLMSGQGLSDIGRGSLSGADALVASRYNRDYEVAALNRQANELATAANQAQAELGAAQARVAAANAATAVANLRAQAAQQDLDTFDSQIFTPDVWYRMGDQMWRLYQRYLTMALRAARLMQQAYNFETDQSLKIIKGDYSTDTVKGLLGADALMADIQSLTYDLITSNIGKPQPLKQTISLAQQYGYLFETQFRRTGSMQFETRIEDFDCYYPGTYAGRIKAIEVEVDGIVPVTGISGSLTNSGISAYRLPAALVPPQSTGLKYRVQPKETLILSDYAVRQDTLLAPQDQRIMHIFEGAGVASSWEFSLPKQINDIDYGALTDVKLTFYYEARFDPDLQKVVLDQLSNLPGISARQRSLPLRWVYPDAFFHFQDTGTLKITLRPQDFRGNETKPTITSIGILVATDGTVSAQNLNVSLSTPTHVAIAAATDANGAINSDSGAWVPLAAGTALGDYQIAMTAAGNQQLVKDGKFSLSPIVNIVLLFGYSFTPKA